jgi:hypothetical protein
MVRLLSDLLLIISITIKPVMNMMKHKKYFIEQ